MVVTRDTNDTAKEFFPTMLQLAGDLGCQLSPTPSDPDVLRGLCPFHDASTLDNANTLHINARNTRFWCVLCHAEGNPLAFVSRAWGVSARDAHHLLTTAEQPTTNRPPYPPEHFTPPAGRNTPVPQNTALLTRASRHYAKGLYTNYEPLHYLANLGIAPKMAELHGIGYATGKGLRDHLLKHGINEEELLQSPLFGPTPQIEAFAGRLILSDLDFTSATLWITTIVPDAPEAGSPWPTEKPTPRGIRGFKPYLFNLYSISPRFPKGVLTDDPRLYIVLKTQNHPTVLITQRRRPSLDIKDHCGRIAHSLLNRGLTHLIMAVHDTETVDLLSETILSIAPRTKVTYHTTDTIMDAISLRSRDLKTFMDAAPAPDPASAPDPVLPDPEIPTPAQPVDP